MDKVHPHNQNKQTSTIPKLGNLNEQQMRYYQFLMLGITCLVVNLSMIFSIWILYKSKFPKPSNDIKWVRDPLYKECLGLLRDLIKDGLTKK